MDVKRGGGRSRELPVDVKKKRSKIVVLCLTKLFTERLETSGFHDSMICLTSSMTFAGVCNRVTIGSPRKLQIKYREML